MGRPQRPARVNMVGGYLSELLDAVERVTADCVYDDVNTWPASTIDFFYLLALVIGLCGAAPQALSWE